VDDIGVDNEGPVITAWACAACGAVEGEAGASVDFVCHHCGKPLCREHARLLFDQDFGGKRAGQEALSSHCSACARSHHSRSRLEEGAG
jgi:hypothetical protein